jgi:hypothetical protein
MNQSLCYGKARSWISLDSRLISSFAASALVAGRQLLLRRPELSVST